MGLHWPCWACSIVAGAYGPVRATPVNLWAASQLITESELESERIFTIFGLCPGYVRKCKSNRRGILRQPTGGLPALLSARVTRVCPWVDAVTHFAGTLSFPESGELHQTDSLERRQSSEEKHGWTIYSFSCLDRRRVP